MADATQDRMLAAILGYAIGDAFGMPVFGWSPQTIQDWYGSITGYLPRTFPDGTSVSPGEITDDTEIALCIIESVTGAQGDIDLENIAMRMAWLTRGDSNRWLSPATRSALDGVSESFGYQMPWVDDELIGPDILARALPVGLMHSMGRFDRDALRADTEKVTRITNGSPFAMSLVGTAAELLAHSTRGEQDFAGVVAEVKAGLPAGLVADALAGANGDYPLPLTVLLDAIALATTASTIEELLSEAVSQGGAADSRAALAAALFASSRGTDVIPQRLIDGLESRIYVSLAVPWFYRTVARNHGRAIDLKLQRDFD